MTSPEEIKKSIASEVRAEIGRQGSNRTALADRAEISRSALARKLSAEVSFTTEEIVRVARALGVPATNFLPVVSASRME